MSQEGFNRLKECRHGRMLFNVNDRYIGRSLDLYGEFSHGEVEIFQKLVGPGDVVVEVGANIGVHTVFFAKATSPGGAVLAFEPQRLVFQTLCGNLALNDITNTLAFQQACGSAPGSVVVPVLDPRLNQNFGALALQKEYEEGDQVEVVPLDQYELSRCKLMKVDVEGMELEVLRGAGELIRRCAPVLYVENDRPDRSDALVKHIASLGYNLYWHRTRMFNPQNFAGNAENVFGTTISTNMLCMPGGTIVADMEPVPVP